MFQDPLCVVAKSAIVSQQGEREGYSRRLMGTLLKQMRGQLTTWFLLSLHPYPFLLLPAEDRTVGATVTIL